MDMELHTVVVDLKTEGVRAAVRGHHYVPNALILLRLLLRLLHQAGRSA